MNPPVEIDKEYESEIEEMGRFGDGIARIKGFIIIVPNTGLGKQAKFRITRIGKKFAFGESVLD